MTAHTVIFPFVGDSVGGSHISAMLLMEALPAFGFAPLALLHQAGPLSAKLQQAGLPHQIVDLPAYQSSRSVTRLTRLLLRQPAAARILQSSDAALVHINDSRSVISWALAAKLAKLPLVVHQRTRYAPSRLLHTALRRSDAIACISQYVRDSLPADLTERGQIIHNPFRTEEFAEAIRQRDALRREMGIEPATPLIGFFGSLTEQKRPQLFLQAAAVISRSRSAHFMLVGRAENAMGQPLAQLADQLGIGPQTSFVGYRADVERYLAACDIVLAPAVNEGFGRIPIEAAFANVPVVAARSGGHVEAILAEQTGLLVQPDDADALADAALRLLNTPAQARDLVAHARSRAEATFSVSAHANAMARLYERLIAA